MAGGEGWEERAALLSREWWVARRDGRRWRRRRWQALVPPGPLDTHNPRSRVPHVALTDTSTQQPVKQPVVQTDACWCCWHCWWAHVTLRFLAVGGVWVRVGEGQDEAGYKGDAVASGCLEARSRQRRESHEECGCRRGHLRQGVREGRGRQACAAVSVPVAVLRPGVRHHSGRASEAGLAR